MKSIEIKTYFSFSIPIANIICKIVFDNHKTFSYFKQRFRSFSSITGDIEILIFETFKEYSISIPSESFNSKIAKSNISSKEELYFVIQALIQYALLKYNVFLLHASSIMKNGNGYLFMAPSGSGKSTIVNSLEWGQILSDDVAILQKINNSFFVFSSVFDNKLLINFPIKKAPLKKTFFIKQASFNRLTVNGSDETISAILHNNLLFWLLGLQKKKIGKMQNLKQTELYSLGLELAAASRMKTLYFTKDLSYFKFLK